MDRYDYEEHERELEEQGDDRVHDAVAYTERENASLRKAVERLQEENEELRSRLEFAQQLALEGREEVKKRYDEIIKRGVE